MRGNKNWETMAAKIGRTVVAHVRQGVNKLGTFLLRRNGVLINLHFEVQTGAKYWDILS